MSNVAQIKRAIRKALEEPLEEAFIANSIFIPGGSIPAIAWPNLPFPTDQLGNEYADFTVLFSPSRPLEMGSTPRIVVGGSALINIRTKESTGSDRNDTIAGIVGAAYPYNAALVRDGVSVIIGTTDVVQGVMDGPWWQVPIRVNWMVWN